MKGEVWQKKDVVYNIYPENGMPGWFEAYTIYSIFQGLWTKENLKKAGFKRIDNEDNN